MRLTHNNQILDRVVSDTRSIACGSIIAYPVTLLVHYPASFAGCHSSRAPWGWGLFDQNGTASDIPRCQGNVLPRFNFGSCMVTGIEENELYDASRVVDPPFWDRFCIP